MQRLQPNAGGPTTDTSPTATRRGVGASLRLVLAALLLTTLAVVAPGCSKAKADAVALVNEGVRSLDRGDVDTSWSYFGRAARLDPENAAAHYHLGLVAAYYKDEPAKARTHFERALELEAGHVETLFQLGRLHAVDGDPGKAAGLLEQATSIDPNHAGAWHFKGVALLRTDSNDKADAALRESITIQPRESRSFVALGSFYEEHDHDEAAREVYEAGLKHNPGSPDLLNSLGVLELRYREMEGSLEHLTEALSRDAGRTDTLYNLAFAYAEAGQKRQAVRHLAAYLQKADPVTDKEHLRVATALRETLLLEM